MNTNEQRKNIRFGIIFILRVWLNIEYDWWDWAGAAVWCVSCYSHISSCVTVQCVTTGLSISGPLTHFLLLLRSVFHEVFAPILEAAWKHLCCAINRVEPLLHVSDQFCVSSSSSVNTSYRQGQGRGRRGGVSSEYKCSKLWQSPDLGSPAHCHNKIFHKITVSGPRQTLPQHCAQIRHRAPGQALGWGTGNAPKMCPNCVPFKRHLILTKCVRTWTLIGACGDGVSDCYNV